MAVGVISEGNGVGRSGRQCLVLVVLQEDLSNLSPTGVSSGEGCPRGRKRAKSLRLELEERHSLGAEAEGWCRGRGHTDGWDQPRKKDFGFSREGCQRRSEMT